MEIVSGQMDFPRDVLNGLEWSLNEITDNVLNHSRSEEGGWFQVVTFAEKGEVEFVVADPGRGIPAAMRERFPELQTDARAIEEAVKAGVTSSPEAGQGNGLTGALRVATLSGGTFQVISGTGSLFASTERSQTRVFRSDAAFIGTLVSVRISKHRQFTMAEALGFAGVAGVAADFIDLLHEDESGNNLQLRLADEANGFRSRGAGAFVRTKCMNFLGAAPNKGLIIDWSGVPLVSSSFADEAIGKLFVELGPIGFGARIKHVGMEGLVRNLVDKAILQRAAQHIGHAHVSKAPTEKTTATENAATTKAPVMEKAPTLAKAPFGNKASVMEKAPTSAKAKAKAKAPVMEKAPTGKSPVQQTGPSKATPQHHRGKRKWYRKDQK
jgi:anti-sigma regulatory factor (Ser/Thr protein kinase)